MVNPAKSRSGFFEQIDQLTGEIQRLTVEKRTSEFVPVSCEKSRWFYVENLLQVNDMYIINLSITHRLFSIEIKTVNDRNLRYYRLTEYLEKAFLTRYSFFH